MPSNECLLLRPNGLQADSESGQFVTRYWGLISGDLNPVKVEVSDIKNGLVPAPHDKSEFRGGSVLHLHLSQPHGNRTFLRSADADGTGGGAVIGFIVQRRVRLRAWQSGRVEGSFNQ